MICASTQMLEHRSTQSRTELTTHDRETAAFGLDVAAEVSMPASRPQDVGSVQVVGSSRWSPGALGRGDGAEVMWIWAVVSGDADLGSAPVLLAGPAPHECQPTSPADPSACAVPSPHGCQNGNASGRRGHAPPPSHGCQGGVPWNRRPATPGRGRGVGVRVLVRAGSEKCRDVQESRMT